MSTSPQKNATFISQYGMLILILLVYLIVGALFAVYTPPWQAPDEPAHYNYAAQVATNGCCPTIQPGDWDLGYLDSLKAHRFAPELLTDLSRVQYEDHQPPLYYLVQSAVYGLTGGSLIAMRLMSVLMGLGIVVCAYGIGCATFPNRSSIALGTAALVAFLPQHIAILASVSNDALSNLIIAGTLLATLHYLKGEQVKSWHLGLLVGLGLLTKVSTLFLIGLVPIAILLKWWTAEAHRTWKILIQSWAAFFIPALLMGVIWWMHSIQVYGFPDLFGLRQHDSVVVGQPRTADLIAQVGWGEYLKSALQTTFNSFWGQFGWMGVPMPSWIYTAILGLLVVCISGWGIGFLIPKQPNVDGTEKPVGRNIFIILVLTALLAVAMYIYYNTVFLQLQGRYLFTGITVFALGLAWGLDNWVRWLGKRIPMLERGVWLGYVPAVVFGLFAVLDVYLLWRVIVPALSI